jgi:hypothetical protein
MNFAEIDEIVREEKVDEFNFKIVKYTAPCGCFVEFKVLYFSDLPVDGKFCPEHENLMWEEKLYNLIYLLDTNYIRVKTKGEKNGEN